MRCQSVKPPNGLLLRTLGDSTRDDATTVAAATCFEVWREARFDEPVAILARAEANHPAGTRLDLPFGRLWDSGCSPERPTMGIQEFLYNKLIRTACIDAAA
jgi:hypothetical protein